MVSSTYESSVAKGLSLTGILEILIIYKREARIKPVVHQSLRASGSALPVKCKRKISF